MASSSLRVLYIGGTGTISAACVRRSLALGHEVTVLNRGRSTTRSVPEGVGVLTADVAEPGALGAALAGSTFDAVVDFLSFTPEDCREAMAAVRGRTGQYVQISSASVYDRTRARLPVVESSPRGNRWS